MQDLKPEQLLALAQNAKLELARRYLYDYMTLIHGSFYTPEKEYLKDVCDDIQWFIEQNDIKILILSMPPRFGKSFTGSGTVEWIFGKNNRAKVMTGSYNETLSGTFAKQVRDTIDTKKISSDVIVYNDIFKDTRIKYGEASASMWALDGSPQRNYLATSPTGTATGFGTNYLIIDDIIKNAEEAYNENVKEKHWLWFTNTMMSRLEGDDAKVIIIMTRWATDDLAGRILAAFPTKTKLISYSAIKQDGSMLCESVLSREQFDLKTQEMSVDIVEANYNQKPIDIKGRLYTDFKTYDRLPQGTHKILNYTDTADTGSDFLCSINYTLIEKEAYITDVEFSDAPMETTEPRVAQMLHEGDVNTAEFESNNGGRGFARNIQRILAEEYKSNRTVVRSIPQTKNKEARILASSAWVVEHVYMPLNWKHKWPEFHRQLTSYQSKGKNAHDDAPDVLASIYEKATGKMKPKVYNKASTGLYTKAHQPSRGYWG